MENKNGFNSENEQEKKPLMLALMETTREWKSYMRKIALEAGIPDSYRMIVMHLAKFPGANQKELAERSNKTTAAISQTIKEMQYTGYIVKETDESDRRLCKLYLTEKGRASAERARERLKRADALITSVVTEEKEKELIEFFADLSELIRKEL
ncbi:MAG: winged helix-turn-helix transcriptional regulator [Ruminococcaceae bacterium]|nr:winged helix-turn-helix transcriptional regulator [Oscillospiraceae bacterium]